MLKLKWYDGEDERIISRKQIITEGVQNLLNSPVETELMDNLYPSEVKWIRKNYPMLEVFVGLSTQADKDDQRHSCIVRKKDVE